MDISADMEAARISNLTCKPYTYIILLAHGYAFTSLVSLCRTPYDASTCLKKNSDTCVS